VTRLKPDVTVRRVAADPDLEGRSASGDRSVVVEDLEATECTSGRKISRSSLLRVRAHSCSGGVRGTGKLSAEAGGDMIDLDWAAG
jgi:hypothetical protein